MAFWGVTDDRQGHGVIIETPDDAAIHLVRLDDRLAIAPEWDTQKGQLEKLAAGQSQPPISFPGRAGSRFPASV